MPKGRVTVPRGQNVYSAALPLSDLGNLHTWSEAGGRKQCVESTGCCAEIFRESLLTGFSANLLA